MVKPRGLPAEAQLAAALAGLNFVRAVQRCAGLTEYDAPVVSGDRLHFRVNFQRGIDQGWSRWAETGDWAAYSVALAASGSFQVFHARLPERSATRSESVRAAFSALTDATKFVMANVLDSVRTKYGLDSLFVSLRQRGLDDRLSRASPEPSETAHLVPHRSDSIGKLQHISLRTDPTRVAIGFAGVEPYLNVMALSMGEVAAALVEGLPDEVVECAFGAGGIHL